MGVGELWVFLTVGEFGIPQFRPLEHYAEYVYSESGKGELALGGYETQILAMRLPTGFLYYR